MGTPAVIDFATLLAPVSAEAPAGEDLSDHEIMYDLRSLADTARSAEKKWALVPLGPDGKPAVPEGTPAPPTPNWTPVVKSCQDILRSRSKDLTVCAFLMEAMVRTHGFAGVRDVATLIAGLAEEYWGSLFPRFDQDEYEALETHPTVAAISGLNGASVLPFAINRIILIRTSPCGPLTGIDYLDAFDSQVRVKRDQFETAARAVPPATFDLLYDDALAALAAYRKMVTLLSDKCQQSDNVDGPSGSAVETVLDDSVRRIRHISGRPETSDADLSPTEGLETGAAGGDFSTSSPMSSNGSLQSRAEAYEMLQKVADFFSRTEPHSPVCASLLRIVSWRNLSFPELMMELVEHHDARRELFRLTGVREEQS